jgi:lysyl endopeptidase
VLAGDWLPRAPDSTSFGPKPPSLHDRHVVLNQKFADAWRISKTTSLFDYAAGTSTANFTDINWPPESGQPCRTSLPSNPPLRRMQPELAQAACRSIRDKALVADCLFDVTVMGDRSVARGYLLADKAKAGKATRPARVASKH